MIGRTLGRYRIVARLGEGGMGSVWRAEDPALGRNVALKLLSPALWDSDSARQRFLQEARAGSKFDYSGIATVFDVGETDGLAWIAYQFIDGESVAARVRRGPLPQAEALGLGLGAAEALAHAHERGVLHRDVTAGNVMVTRDGRAVLVDFGLALPVRSTRLTATGSVLGTAGYMAPEVIRGEPADERSDLYGLGAVLYRMLTARLPFEGGAPEAVYSRVLREPAPAPSGLRPEISPALERVVLRLLERNPVDRYASATEVAAALRAVAPDATPSRLDRARRAVTRCSRQVGGTLRSVGRRQIGVAALASVALLSTTVWFGGKQGWWPGAPVKPPILAVLPFRNETENPEETRYIADGLAATLATNLAQTDRLRVLPWVTTQRVQPDSMPLLRLAKELNARKLLLGTLRSTPGGLTVALSLIDGKDGTQLWSRPFEGTDESLPSLEALMLFEVATTLLGALTPAERSRMALPSGRDGRAYNLYLEGASHLSSGDPPSLLIAEQFFRRSLELDSTFADAHVGLGAVYNARYWMGIEGGTENIQLAARHFEAGARLDPASPLAMRALVSLYFQQGRTEAALELGQRAYRTRPLTVDLRLVAEQAYVLGGLADVGLRIGEEILAEDPSNPAARFYAVLGAAWSGEAGRTLHHCGEYIRRFGEDPEIYCWMSLAAFKLRQPEKALVFVRRSSEIEGDERDPRSLYFLATLEEVVLGSKGARATWERLRDLMVARLLQEPDQPRNRLILMTTLTWLGDRDGALKEWRALRPWIEDLEDQVSPDVNFMPFILVRLDARDEARHLIEALDRRGIFFEDTESLGDLEFELLKVTDDPLVQEYMARGRRRADALRKRFGTP